MDMGIYLYQISIYEDKRDAISGSICKAGSSHLLVTRTRTRTRKSKLLNSNFASSAILQH